MSKAAKHRICPAVKHEISSAECGENRGSRYACPADCEHSPLASANYDLLLKVEEDLDRKSAERFVAEQKKSPDLHKAALHTSDSSSPHAFHAFCEHALFFQKDDHGLSLAQRWQREGFPGLKNDERVLFQAKMQTRVALLEIHRIIDDQQLEAVDLLEAAPRTILLRDRSLAARATRFSAGLCWVYPLPHYWRLGGTAIILPEFAQFGPDEILIETARHLGAPIAEEELRPWLAENYVRIDESLQATAKMRQMQMLSGLDLEYGKAVYEWRAPFGACRDILDTIAGVEPDSLSQTERDEGFAAARVWLAEHDPAKTTDAPMILGRVLLGQSHCRIESVGRQRLATLRKHFENVLGERGRFSNERFEDLGAKLKETAPPSNLAIIPPRLLEEPTKMLIGATRVERPPGATLEEVAAAQRVRQNQAFLEDPVPALDGRTPREAAKDPALRAKLLRLLKQRVRGHDEDNLNTGRNDDINWLLRELGALEIIFDPPPLRQIPPEPDEPRNEFAEDFIDDSGLPLPALPEEALLPKEVAARLDDGIRDFPTVEAALDYLDACGSLFIEDASQLCASNLSPEHFDIFLPFLVQIRFALVPRGFREPELNFDRLTDAYHQSFEALAAVKNEGPDFLYNWFESSRQPHLIKMVALTMNETFRNLPSTVKPSPESEMFMIIALRHMTDELDLAIR